MRLKVERKRIQDILVGLFCVCVATIVYGCKGVGQLGNTFSFVGTVVTLLPPLNQYRINRRYQKVQREGTGSDFGDLDKRLESARLRRLMAFDMRDFAYITIGLILVALGFLLQIVTAKADV